MTAPWPAGVKEIIGWAAGSVSLRLQQLNSVETAHRQKKKPRTKGDMRRGFSLEEVGDSVTESSVFAKEWDIAGASIAPPVYGESRHCGLTRRLVAMRRAFDVAVVTARPHPGAALRPDCIEEEDAANNDASSSTS